MKKILSLLIIVAGMVRSSYAQTTPGTPTAGPGNTAGLLYASNFGLWSIPQGNTGQFSWSSPSFCTVTAANIPLNPVFKVGTPVYIKDSVVSNSEIVIPSAVNVSGSGCSITVTPTHPHLSFTLQSGTAGLQEAINYAHGLPYQVIITPDWTRLGGTTGMILAASGNANVSIIDERTACYVSYLWSGSYVAQPSACAASAGVAEILPGSNISCSPNVAGSCTGNVTINSTATSTTVNVNGTPINDPNFNGTTPTAESNGKNVAFQASASNVSAEIVGDGDASHYLDGTSHYTTPAGLGAFNGGLGTSFQDVTETAAPANPSAGNDRLYTNNTTHKLACLTSGGVDCMPASGGSPASPTGTVQVNKDGSSFASASNHWLFEAGVSGAKCDEQTVATGSITSSGSTLTAGSSVFAPGDVGKVILVKGAGVAGADLKTTIASFISGTQVTVTLAAGTTVSGASVYWGTDDSTAFNALLSTVYAASGGEIEIYGSCIINAQITLPNDGVSSPNPSQPGIRIHSSVASANGNWQTGTKIPPATTGVLDDWYSAANGKILTLGAGRLEIDHLSLIDHADDCTGFLYDTNTTLEVHHNLFSGAKSGTAACNDVATLGGTTASSGGTVNNWFQGYGTYFDHNFLDKIRRFVYTRDAGNAINISDNTVSLTCGSTSATGVFEFGFSGVSQSQANRTSGNIIEVGNYPYSYVIWDSNNQFFGDSFWDATGTTLKLFHFAGGTLNMASIAIDASIPESKVSDAVPLTDGNSVMDQTWQAGNALAGLNGRLCKDTSGSGTTQSCNTPIPFTPQSGAWIIYRTTTDNTGNLTINVNGLGAASVAKWQGTTTLAAHDIRSGADIPMFYDGTNWETMTIGNAPSGSSGLSGMTAGQVPIAATATTVTSSEALAGAGAGITTGPASGTTADDLVTMNGTNGQIKDSGVLSTNVVNSVSPSSPIVASITGHSLSLSCPTCGTGSGGTSVSQNSGSAETNLPITGFMPQVCSDTSGSGTVQVCTVANTFVPQANNCIVYTSTTANSGAGLTVNVNSLGAKSVAIPSTTGWSTTLSTGILTANKPRTMCYDGTNWNVNQTGTVASSGGLAQPFAVLQKSVQQYGNASSSLVITFPKASTATNTMFVIASTDATITFSTPAGWTKDFDVTSGASGGRLVLFEKASAGETSLTLTLSGGTSSSGMMFELAGTRTYDTSTNTTTTSTGLSVVSPPSITPISGSMVFALFAYGDSGFATYTPVIEQPLNPAAWSPIGAANGGASSRRSFAGVVYQGTGAGSALQPPQLSIVPVVTVNGPAAVSFSIK